MNDFVSEIKDKSDTSVSMRYVLHETSASLVFVDFYKNGDMVIHELFSDPDIKSVNPDIKYHYHSIQAVRGNDVKILRDVLNMIVEKRG